MNDFEIQLKLWPLSLAVDLFHLAAFLCHIKIFGSTFLSFLSLVVNLDGYSLCCLEDKFINILIKIGASVEPNVVLSKKLFVASSQNGNVSDNVIRNA